MKSIAYSLVFMATALASCSAQFTTYGSCPNFHVVAPFDLQRYLGTWYEYARYDTSFQKDARCVSAEYSDESSEEGPQIGVINKSIKEGRDTYSNSTGEAVFSEPDNPSLPAKLIVNFDRQPWYTRFTRTNYNVVYTDYSNMAVVYACNSRFIFWKREFLFILTRERFPDTSFIELAYQKCRENGIDTTRLTVTDQEIC